VFNGETQGALDAFEALTAAFGHPTPTPSGGFRWSVPRGTMGRQVVIDFTPSTSPRSTDTVWVFNPEAAGVSSVFAFDVSTRSGLASLRNEVNRLHAPS
jgi:hypothetical protein